MGGREGSDHRVPRIIRVQIQVSLYTHVLSLCQERKNDERHVDIHTRDERIYINLIFTLTDYTVERILRHDLTALLCIINIHIMKNTKQTKGF